MKWHCNQINHVFSSKFLKTTPTHFLNSLFVPIICLCEIHSPPPILLFCLLQQSCRCPWCGVWFGRLLWADMGYTSFQQWEKLHKNDRNNLHLSFLFLCSLVLLTAKMTSSPCNLSKCPQTTPTIFFKIHTSIVPKTVFPSTFVSLSCCCSRELTKNKHACIYMIKIVPE